MYYSMNIKVVMHHSLSYIMKICIHKFHRFVKLVLFRKQYTQQA